MKTAILLSVLLFALVAVAHLLRLVFQVEVLIDGVTIPIWLSVPGVLVPAVLAVALYREAGK